MAGDEVLSGYGKGWNAAPRGRRPTDEPAAPGILVNLGIADRLKHGALYGWRMVRWGSAAAR